jgi:hypothetical protein
MAASYVYQLNANPTGSLAASIGVAPTSVVMVPPVEVTVSFASALSATEKATLDQFMQAQYYTPKP